MPRMKLSEHLSSMTTWIAAAAPVENLMFIRAVPTIGFEGGEADGGESTGLSADSTTSFLNFLGRWCLVDLTGCVLVQIYD